MPQKEVIPLDVLILARGREIEYIEYHAVWELPALRPRLRPRLHRPDIPTMYF